VLTGNLYPTDNLMTRAEVLGVPMIVVRGDTFSTAKLMETVQATQKLRAQIKINHGAQLINANVDVPALRKKLGV
jgi:BioD-like phosphotransacetylase family protein